MLLKECGHVYQKSEKGLFHIVKTIKFFPIHNFVSHACHNLHFLIPYNPINTATEP